MLGLGSLRCRLGWHRPRAGGRWNHGYCFTMCERCGRDMVRSAFGEWHVPSGFRVVRGTRGAIEALDTVLAARDGGIAAGGGDFAWADSPAPPAAPITVVTAPPPVKPPPAPPPPAPRPAARVPAAPPARRAPAGSPFDFADFDAVDPSAGAAAPPPPRPDPANPPLSRAAP